MFLGSAGLTARVALSAVYPLHPRSQPADQIGLCLLGQHLDGMLPSTVVLEDQELGHCYTRFRQAGRADLASFFLPRLYASVMR